MFRHKKSMLKLKKFKSSFPQQELRRAKPIDVDERPSAVNEQKKTICSIVNI